MNNSEREEIPPGTSEKAGLNEVLERQRSIFLDELENRFSLFASQSKSASSEPVFKFANEGNKIQFDFNQARIEGLNKISSLSEIGSEVTKAAVSSEISALQQRNKVLKIADKHGWDTVKEYCDSPLADDPEDAAKLRGAIARAMRNRRFKPYQSPEFRPRFTQAKQSQSAGKSTFRPFSENHVGSLPRAFGPFLQNSAINPGSCFACHLYGHFAKDCPYVQRNNLPRSQLNPGPKCVQGGDDKVADGN